MNLRSIEEIGERQKVILRMDLDVPMEGSRVTDNERLKKSVPTIRLLLERNCKIVIIGHRGRPEGREEELSLKPVYVELMGILEPLGESVIESVFIDNIEDEKIVETALEANQIVVGENLRFWKGEEENDPGFLKAIIDQTDAYVNDAFAVAHREHRSIMIYREKESFYGLSFVEEMEKIRKVVEDPKRPLTIILGGAKEDKLKYLKELSDKADRVLIGGKLPLLIQNLPQPLFDERGEEKVVWAKLREDKFDLSDQDIDNFKELIKDSKTIIWAGAMGWFEKEESRRGTEEIAKAIAENDGAYKIIAGGDTGAAVESLGLKSKIDYVCSGGGAMLEFLVKKKLPAWN